MNEKNLSQSYNSVLDSDLPFLILNKPSTLLLSGTPAEVYQFIFLKKGKIHYSIVSDTHIIPGKCILFIPEKEKAQITCSADIELFHIIFKKVFLQHLLDSDCEAILIDTFLSGFRKNSINNILLTNSVFFRLSYLFDEIFYEQKTRGVGYRSLIRSRIIEIIIILFRQKRVKNRNKNGMWNIGDVTYYIDTHYTENFTLHEMAHRCGLNPSYFSRLFKEKTGVSLFEYLNRIRIQKSCTLLNRSHMSILNVAYAVGYNNISFFNRYFRKIMNMSPREYKKQSGLL